MLREVSLGLRRCDCVQRRSVRRGLTIQMQRTGERWLVVMQRLLAAADLGRCTASFLSGGGSLEFVC